MSTSPPLTGTQTLSSRKETPSTVTSRTAWFRKARLGLFFHWGPYSVPGRGEWIMNRERISPEEYQSRFIDHWRGDSYDPEEWMALARETGAGYVILTTRHHDGFCLWDTDTTDWNACNLGPGQDLVTPFVEAARAADLKVGFYFSGADWTHPDYPGAFYRDWPENKDWASEASRERFFAYYREQVRELMTRYGKIDLLWWDGCQPEPFGGDEVNAMVRELQPDILINERNGSGFDFRNSEQTVRAKDGVWESCLTLNSNWGWHSGDHQWMSSKENIMNLINAASKDGNLLLNIGPKPDGTVPEPCRKILQDMGSWLKRNRDFLSQSERNGFSWNNCCQITVKNNRIYFHFHTEIGSEFCWAELRNRVKAAWFLASGDPVSFHQEEDRVWLTDLPTPLPDSPVTTVVLEVEGAPEPLTKTTSFWIPT